MGHNFVDHTNLHNLILVLFWSLWMMQYLWLKRLWIDMFSRSLFLTLIFFSWLSCLTALSQNFMLQPLPCHEYSYMIMLLSEHYFSIYFFDQNFYKILVLGLAPFRNTLLSLIKKKKIPFGIFAFYYYIEDAYEY